MVSSAKHVHLVDVFSVRECGISSNFMLVLAKNPSATFHVAGAFIKLERKNIYRAFAVRIARKLSLNKTFFCFIFYAGI